mmetsp:Transcript_32914/g.78104  ORF Transcript_32914/g.78104 Transcript_32914/m.78104 type:complete len:208 (+) Transcript_32914:84-707(+)
MDEGAGSGDARWKFGRAGICCFGPLDVARGAADGREPSRFRGRRRWTQNICCTLVALKTLQMVSPRRLATLSTVSCLKWRSAVVGMELVTMTSWKTPLERRSTAGGLNTAWVLHAYTSRAPSWWRTLAALVIVPAVSIMSSTSTATFPRTSPMRFITSLTLCADRRLSTIASGASLSFLANALARATPPTSGETTTRSPVEIRLEAR